MKRLLYLTYLCEWHITHSGKTFKGCCPACYNEWLDCEFSKMVEYPWEYSGHWYSGILNYYHKREKNHG